MNRPLFRLINEEWKDYEIEVNVLQQQYPGCELKSSDYDHEHDLEEFGYHVDTIIAQVYMQIPASVIQWLENRKGVIVLSGGYDRIDTEAARAKGIGATNMQGYRAEDLADYVLTVTFHSHKSLIFYHDSLKNGEWDAQAAARVPRWISHSTLFVIGCGRIGSTVAERCQSLGMRAIVYDPNRSGEALRKPDIEPVTMEEGLRQANYVSLDVKLDEDIAGLIGEQEFSLMKFTVYFINTAHGATVEERELVKTLGNHVIAGTAVDVIAHEPPKGQGPIFNAPSCIITPHVSYIPQESFEELHNRVAQNVIWMLCGERPEDLVG